MRRALTAALLIAPTVAWAEGPYHFQPGAHRDPFVDPAAPKGPVPEGHCTGSPLCAVKLSEVKLTAVVTGTANRLAMIEDASGEYMIREGMHIGATGTVTRISPGQVVITEVMYSANAPRPVERVLTLDPQS